MTEFDFAFGISWSKVHHGFFMVRFACALSPTSGRVWQGVDGDLK